MANRITLSRFPLLLAIILLLYADPPLARLVAVPLIIVLILLDSVDGMVARARHEASLMGSVLDIMADRTVELLLWICLGHLRLVPVAIPLIYVFRGTVVDALRSIHVRQGTAPFQALHTPWGRFLVGSPLMRSGYGITKATAFAGLAFSHALLGYAAQQAVSQELAQTSLLIFQIVAWVSVLFCLARGAPVVIEALAALRRHDAGKGA